MKVAIFGSSYVKRASNFADFVGPFEGGRFGIGWNTASDPCLNLISKILRYSTDIVVVCLRGNKISRGVEPPTVIYCLTRLFRRPKLWVHDNLKFSSQRSFLEENSESLCTETTYVIWHQTEDSHHQNEETPGQNLYKNRSQIYQT